MSGPLSIQTGRGSLTELQSLLDAIQGQLHIFTTAPALADMSVGEIAMGNATESSPAAGSHAIYAKVTETTIAVLAFRAAGGAPHSRLIT